MQVKTIIGHSIWQFLNDVQEAVIDGYRLSEKSEYFPYSTGPLNVVHLVKEETAEKITSEPSKEISIEDEIGEVEYNPDLVALADVVDIEEQSGAAIPPVEKKKPGRKAKV